MERRKLISVGEIKKITEVKSLGRRQGMRSRAHVEGIVFNNSTDTPGNNGEGNVYG